MPGINKNKTDTKYLHTKNKTFSFSLFKKERKKNETKKRTK
jgi:hypothetical protein